MSEPLTVTGLVRATDHGSDWWRTIEPFVLAQALGHDCYCAVRGHPLVHPPDILVFRGEFFPADVARAFVDQCERDRVLVVVDCDDWYELGDPTASPEAAAQAAMLDCAHLVTTTTIPLADAISVRYSRDVAVVPNAINLAAWQDVTRPDINNPILTVAGSESHRGDYTDVLPVFLRLAKRFPRLRFRLIGCLPDWWERAKKQLGWRLDYRDWVPFARYSTLFAGSTVVWQPLADTSINRSRSPIRHWEATAAGAAFVGSPLVYNQSVIQAETGYLTDDPRIAVEQISVLFADERLRTKMVSAAMVDVRVNYALDEIHVDERFTLYCQEWHNRYEPIASFSSSGNRDDAESAERAAKLRQRASFVRQGAAESGRQLDRQPSALYGPDGRPLSLPQRSPRVAPALRAN